MRFDDTLAGILRRRGRDDSGAAAVEFALIAPLLLMMLFGIVCFGYFFLVAHSVQQLAAETARTSIRGITAAEREMVAQQFVAGAAMDFPFLRQDAINAVIDVTSGSEAAILVEVTYDLTGSIVGIADGFLGFDISSITASSYVTY